MSARARILVMPAGQFQVPAVLEAQRLGYEVLAIDRNPNAEAFAYADFTETIDPADVDRVARTAENHRVRAVFPVAHDLSVITGAIVAKRLGLNAVPVDVARRCRNKRLTRHRLREHRPSYCPEFCVLESSADLPGAVHRLGFPLIMKPTDSSGSKGVLVVDNDKNLADGYAYARSFSEEGVVLAEELLASNQVSVESITYRGRTEILAIGDTLTTSLPFRATTGHTMPATLSQEAMEEVGFVVRETLALLGSEQGPSHLEFCLTEDGPKLLDVAARVSGGFIASHLVPIATGVNVLRAVLSVALGQTPDVRHTTHRGAAIRFFNPPAGVVQTVDGLEDARAIPGVLDVACQLAPGDTASPIENSAGRVGHVLAHGKDAAEAAERAERALRSVRITLQPRRFSVPCAAVSEGWG